jgi:hypothetical protein
VGCLTRPSEWMRRSVSLITPAVEIQSQVMKTLLVERVNDDRTERFSKVKAFVDGSAAKLDAMLEVFRGHCRDILDREKRCDDCETTLTREVEATKSWVTRQLATTQASIAKTDALFTGKLKENKLLQQRVAEAERISKESEYRVAEATRSLAEAKAEILRLRSLMSIQH